MQQASFGYKMTSISSCEPWSMREKGSVWVGVNKEGEG